MDETPAARRSLSAGDLPDAIAGRVQRLTLEGGMATCILDAGGLGAGERAQLEDGARAALLGMAGVDDVRIALTGERVKRQLVAIGSGKGGVGKSTLTANLAVALAQMGHKVGVIDADIYGPSQAKLLDCEGLKAEAQGKQLVALDSPHGVRVLSMAHLIEPGRAIAWRGPMAAGALTQLVEADWGDAEILLMDLPPGTGDVQITMLQKHRPDGAVIVSTPQDLALIDAMRAGQLFEQGQVPVIGLVENMAGYVCPHCGEASDPFGRGGVETAAQRLDIPFLGRIPLTMDLRRASDAGTPLAEGVEAQGFAAIAQALAGWLAEAGR